MLMYSVMMDIVFKRMVSVVRMNGVKWCDVLRCVVLVCEVDDGVLKGEV